MKTLAPPRGGPNKNTKLPDLEGAFLVLCKVAFIYIPISFINKDNHIYLCYIKTSGFDVIFLDGYPARAHW